MCPSMKQRSMEPEYSVEEESPKKGQQVVIGEDSIQGFLDLEVDLVVLSQELSKLDALCSRIVVDLHMLRVQWQDTE